MSLGDPRAYQRVAALNSGIDTSFLRILFRAHTIPEGWQIPCNNTFAISPMSPAISKHEM